MDQVLYLLDLQDQILHLLKQDQNPFHLLKLKEQNPLHPLRQLVLAFLGWHECNGVFPHCLGFESQCGCLPVHYVMVQNRDEASEKVRAKG
jgi:hypothetical protein